MNNEIKLILEGVKKGDQIGGPFELSKILANSLQANNGFNKDDLTKRYLKWWKEDAFDTGPTYASVFSKIDKGMDPKLAIRKVHEEFGFNTNRLVRQRSSRTGRTNMIQNRWSNREVPPIEQRNNTWLSQEDVLRYNGSLRTEYDSVSDTSEDTLSLTEWTSVDEANDERTKRPT